MKIKKKIVIYQAGIKQFYSQLTQKKSPTHATAGEWVSWGTESFLCIIAAIYQLISLVLWLALASKGLKEMNNSLEDIVWLVALCSVSNLALYCRTGFKAPQVVREVYNKPGLQAQPFLKRIGIMILFLSPFLVFGAFSGSGYSETAKNLEDKGYGKVGEDLLASQFFLFVAYQALFNLVHPIWILLYFLIASGVFANGVSAFNGFLDHAPENVRKKLPVLFDDGKPKIKSDEEKAANPQTYISTSRLNFSLLAARDIKPKEFEQPLSEEDFSGLSDTIETSRALWVKAIHKENFHRESWSSWIWKKVCGGSETKPLLQDRRHSSNKTGFDPTPFPDDKPSKTDDKNCLIYYSPSPYPLPQGGEGENYNAALPQEEREKFIIPLSPKKRGKNL